MKHYLLFLIAIAAIYAGCIVYTPPQRTTTPAKVYPVEENFLRTMAIGDTVFIFIKESGYFQPYRNYNISEHFTCYTRQEICRVDSFLYKSRDFYLTPGGPSLSHGGPNFEFDTVKFDLQKALNACNSLEFYCVPQQDRSYLALEDSCLWRQPAPYAGKSGWLEFTTLGMSDAVYNKWRFHPPSHAELKAWRESMFMNDPKPVWKYEVLSFYKDTCKISYCDKLPTSYAYDFSKLR